MMNKILTILLAVVLCAAAALAVYPRAYRTSHKTHLGGAAYGYRPVKYVSHGAVYKKPVVYHSAPIVYAHKSYAKPRVTHYIKPSYHVVPHVAPVYHSKPVYYLGGHTGHVGHGIAYKPAVYGHGLSYVRKGHHY